MSSTRFLKLQERVVYHGSLIRAGEATFSDPDGHSFVRDVVRHPGAVVVVPVLAGETHVLMVRQYRAAPERELLELPAGLRDVDGEPVEDTARRELAEEVGMAAGRIEKVAECYSSPGFCDEYSYVFMARDLTDCGKSAVGVEEQNMTVERIALGDVAALVAARELVDAKSIMALLLARELLGTSSS